MSATDGARRARRRAVAALALGLAVGGTGAAGASGWIGRTDRPAPLQAGSPPASEAGSYTPGRIGAGQGLSASESIERTIAGLRGTPVRSTELLPAPAGYETGLSWVGVHVDRSDPHLDETEAIWLAGLVQGAVADRMRTGEARTSDVVGGGMLIDDGADGPRSSIDLGTGSIAGGQAFRSPDDDVLTRRTHEVADKFGIEVASATVLHPLESALAVTFVVPDDRAPAWTIDDLRAALEGVPTAIEGAFIKLVAPDGRTLLSAGTSYRTGEGGLSFADGQDLRFGAVHSMLGDLSGDGAVAAQ